MNMIPRFSLYGFLKNMQFFEPFIILYFLQNGLSFFQIGILISIRSVSINILEIPSGAFADIYGKKNAMLISLSSYIVSFIIFFISHSFGVFAVAMIIFAFGEAFRTGTHKAMIFEWLKNQDRLSEKTQVYGYTRSWSKIGSAVSVIISAVIVVISQGYRYIFIFSIVPYIIGLWNIICYPEYMNIRKAEGYISVKKIFVHLFDNIKQAFRVPAIRRLITEVTVFEGIYDVAGDYLQPIIKAQAAVLAAMLIFNEKESTALIVGLVYFILHLISATGSRNSFRFVRFSGTEKRALSFLIAGSCLIIIASSMGLYFSFYVIPIVAYIFYSLVQNIWRPILVSQYDDVSDVDNQATILSIESQSKSTGIFLLAPVIGLIADSLGIYVSLAAMALLLFMLWVYSVKSR